MPRLRVLSWNVHGCVGSDGRFDPERVARVIEERRPDVVLLQEVGDLRGVHPPIDQATVVAELLGMESAVGITVPSEPFGYGNATLLRRPLRPSESEVYDLTVAPHEPRLCLALSVGGLRAANVHLGLGRKERRRQLAILLDERGPLLHHGGAPTVLGGDFNDWPPGAVTSALERAFVDAARLGSPRPAKTWPSFRPLLRLDRLYIAGAVEVIACGVDASPRASAASDHLPLWAELAFAERSPAPPHRERPH
jgi:endonuclease/exonuclease/phosphatase family metal-dependent hydrolase